MSQAIRQVLGPTLTRTRALTTEATQLLAGEAAELQQLLSLSEKLTRNTNLVQQKLDQWNELLRAENADAEEQVFNAFLSGGETPGALLVAALEQITELDLRADLLRTQMNGNGAN